MAEPRVFLKENRGRIEENYLEQAKNLPRVFAPVDEKLQKCTEEVALACKYLYAFMPYSDIGNYPFEVFLDYAENGVRLWKEMTVRYLRFLYTAEEMADVVKSLCSL